MKRVVWSTAAVVLVTAVAVWLIVRATAPAGGPLRSAPAHGWATTHPVGEPFTDGLEILKFPGAHDAAVLESVELIGADGLEVVGVSLAGPDRRFGSIMHLDGYPPRDPDLSDVRPSDTAMTPDEVGWQLLLGIQATEPGYLTREGLRITYSIDGQTYEREYAAHLAVCTSQKYWQDGECPLPQG